MNDNAVIKEKSVVQKIERLKLSTAVYTDTPITGLVTPHAEEVAHVAFTSRDRCYVWKIKDDEAWVMRKKFNAKPAGVLRLCRVRTLKLVRVGQDSHVTCTCKTWEMKRHGCRHVTWAIGTQPTPGFFDPLWTIAHLSTCGRKGHDSYTAMYDNLRLDNKMPGPCVTLWESLALGDVLGTNSVNMKARIRSAMKLVKLSVNPCEVDDSGKVLVLQADNDSTRRLSCEDFQGNICFQEFEGPPDDNEAGILDCGSNTIAYNDYKDVAQRLAGHALFVQTIHYIRFLVATSSPSIILPIFALTSLPLPVREQVSSNVAHICVGASWQI